MNESSRGAHGTTAAFSINFAPAFVAQLRDRYAIQRTDGEYNMRARVHMQRE
jgi:hypothetical protein